MATPATTSWTTRQLLRWLAAATLGGGLALICVAAYYRVTAPPELPLLTPAKLDEAMGRWRSHEQLDYSMRVHVEGRQGADYEVEVRAGIARSAKRNGNALTNERTFGTWAVAGMFQTLRSDLNNQQEFNLDLRAEFDERYGYPARYQRRELRSYGNEPLKWEAVLSPESGPESP